MRYFFHGSPDSLDVDVLFVIDGLAKIPFAKQKELCDALSLEHQVNGNLIDIAEGQVITCFKGTVDEVNNGLLRTFDCHEQLFQKPITKPLQRHVALKWLRVIRGVLSHCSRTEERAIVKSALRNPFIEQKLDALRLLDFTKLSGYKDSKENILKFIAFQVAQWHALVTSELEIYTKSEAAVYLDSIFSDSVAKDLLYRKPAAQQKHLEFANQLIDLLTETYDEKMVFITSVDGTVLVRDGHQYAVANEKIIC